MSLPSFTPPPPKGLAFELDDLVTLQGWSEANRMRMVVELDHWVEGEEYEEVLAFYEGGSALRCWTMWRAHDHYVLEPMNAPAWHALEIADLLQELLPLRPSAGL